MFAYGPVMLNEALLAAEILERQGLALAVVNHPWLNAFDLEWLAPLIGSGVPLFVVEDHGPTGALGDHLLAVLVKHRLLGTRRFEVFGVDGLPACGTPAEALGVHRLDGASLAARVETSLARQTA